MMNDASNTNIIEFPEMNFSRTLAMGRALVDIVEIAYSDMHPEFAVKKIKQRISKMLNEEPKYVR